MVASLQDKNFLKQVKFTSLEMMQFENNGLLRVSTPLKQVNQILQLNWIVEKRLFIVFNFLVNYENEIKADSDFDATFKTLCSNVFRLLFLQQIPIDIQVTFVNVNKFTNDNNLNFYQYYNSQENMFASNFNQNNISNKYKIPQCNDSCIPLKSPTISFEYVEDDKKVEFHVINARKRKDEAIW